MPRTRIVCTLGPASDSDETAREMIRAGMNVARLNFSHGDRATHRAHITRVRQIARAENANIAILADLQGPKTRVGGIAGGAAALQADAPFVLTTRAVEGNAQLVGVDWATLPLWVEPGQRILLDDGRIELRVVSKTAEAVTTRVITGGILRPRKGLNLPSGLRELPALTDKDRVDLAFAVENQVDYIAQSFVRRASDVMELKQCLAENHAEIPIIAKIERPEAVEHMDAILAAADGVMVARGDLGVEAPPEQVPLYQKSIIQQANAAGKPVITATQMLESMIENPRPTRAEASDVANAILDGSDAVMLSAETAVGKYPVETVQMMARIAQAAEKNLRFRDLLPTDARMPSITDAIGNATCEIAQQLEARLIITATYSGFTARMIARHRPRTPILAVTANAATLRRLALVWGVQAAPIQEPPTLDELVALCLETATKCGAANKGDLVVLTSGAPARAPGRTNMLQVHVLP